MHYTTAIALTASIATLANAAPAPINGGFRLKQATRNSILKQQVRNAARRSLHPRQSSTPVKTCTNFANPSTLVGAVLNDAVYTNVVGLSQAINDPASAVNTLFIDPNVDLQSCIATCYLTEGCTTTFFVPTTPGDSTNGQCNGLSATYLGYDLSAGDNIVTVNAVGCNDLTAIGTTTGCCSGAIQEPTGASTTPTTGKTVQIIDGVVQPVSNTVADIANAVIQPINGVLQIGSGSGSILTAPDASVGCIVDALTGDSSCSGTRVLLAAESAVSSLTSQVGSLDLQLASLTANLGVAAPTGVVASITAEIGALNSEIASVDVLIAASPTVGAALAEITSDVGDLVNEVEEAIGNIGVLTALLPAKSQADIIVSSLENDLSSLDSKLASVTAGLGPVGALAHEAAIAVITADIGSLSSQIASASAQLAATPTATAGIAAISADVDAIVDLIDVL